MIKRIATRVAVVTAIGMSPAFAQAVVEDPGYCAQYYPSANCTNYGPGNPLYPTGIAQSGPAAPHRGLAPRIVHRHGRHHRHS